MTNQQSDYTVKLFYSYSHGKKEDSREDEGHPQGDERYLKELEATLAPLKDTGLVEDWSDQSVLPGERIFIEITEQIEDADIIVSLMSRDYIASDACKKERAYAQQLADNPQKFHVPVIVRPCAWKDVVGDVKALPKDGRPVSKFEDSDDAWMQVLDGMKDVVREVCERRLYLIRKDRFKPAPTDTDHVVFVYGSLLNPLSLARTIGRDSLPIEYIPAHLVNHVTEWGAPSRRLNYSSAKWKSLNHVEWLWLWLAIRRTGNESDVVPGALIKLRDPKFQRVRARESHYNKIVVTDDIRVEGQTVESLDALSSRKITTFAPKLPGDSETRMGTRTAVKTSYYRGIDEYLKKFHPCGTAGLPDLPAGVKWVDGSQADDRVVDVFWGNNSDRRLYEFWSSLERKLYARGVTRTSEEGKETIPFVLRPVILNRQTYREVAHAAEAAVSLMVKAHRLVLETPKLFKMNGYTPVDRRLVDSTPADDSDEPPAVARVDLALLGDRLKVFEVNADSPAGMFHLDQLAELQWKQIESKDLTGDLVEILQPSWDVRACDSVVEAFYRHWERYRERAAASGRSKELRRIAIVDRDVLEAAAHSEFEHFEKMLARARDGVEARIVDLEGLKYEHKELRDEEGMPIDAVYKRILWQEAIEIDKGDQNDPLCKAYLDGAVHVMNSFRSRLVGSKLNMAIARSHSFEANCAKNGIELTREELTALEKYIPETILWEAKQLDDRPADGLYDCVMGNISDWVLKGFHGKGGKEFIDGRSDNPKGDFRTAWCRQDKSYIAQQRQEHGLLDVPVVDKQRPGEVAWKRYPYILGAYVIDGKCVAIEAKTAEKPPINVGQGSLRTPVFSLKE